MKYSTKTLQELKENCKHNTCGDCIVQSVCTEILDSLGNNKGYPRNWTDYDILVMGEPQHKKTNTYTYANIVKALEFARTSCEEDNCISDGLCASCPLRQTGDTCLLMKIIRGFPDELTDSDIDDLATELESQAPKQEILDIIDYISGLRKSSQTYTEMLKLGAKYPPPTIEELNPPYTYEEVKKAIEKIREVCNNTPQLSCRKCKYFKNNQCIPSTILYQSPDELSDEDILAIIEEYFPKPKPIPELITKTIDKQRLEEHLPF